MEQALALLQNTVFSFSMKVCGQRQDAEDTMQEVLLRSVPLFAQVREPQGAYRVAPATLRAERRAPYTPS